MTRVHIRIVEGGDTVVWDEVVREFSSGLEYGECADAITFALALREASLKIPGGDHFARKMAAAADRFDLLAVNKLLK